MLVLILCGACSSTGGSSPEQGGEVSVGEVFTQLREAVELASSGEEGVAAEHCEQAMAQFEVRVEPKLKDACGPLCTTAIEYELGRFRAQLEVSPVTAGAILDDLDDRVKSILE